MKKFMKQLKDKTVNDLLKEEEKLRLDIGKLTLQLKVNPPKNTNEIFSKRKNLAVVLTVLHAKRELARLQTKTK